MCVYTSFSPFFIADYTVEKWEIRLDKNISMEDLVKLFPYTIDAKIQSNYDEELD